MGELGQGPASGACSGLRVLVTDEGEASASPLLTWLGELGCNVRLAAEAADTLRQAIVFRPDLILLDLGLPRLDAFEVARSIRRHAPLAETRLIAVTAFGDDFYGLRRTGVAFHRYLRKPYDFDTLVELVTSLDLIRRSSAAE
jgi:DNA-binding response OmpR family regulator